MNSLIERLYEIFLSHSTISTDTRSLPQGAIFFALKGDNFDGNKYAVQALEAGASYAVIDDKELLNKESQYSQRLLLVDDVLTVLQDLARYHRQHLSIPIIAITGSNGKTTTKELTTRVLSQKYRVYATKGNLNNHIGVPLTLLSMDNTTQIGIVEMGASACGEIKLLCSIAQPNFGLVNNIGRAHLEGFGGESGVQRGKGELYDFLSENGGRAVVASQDETLSNMAHQRANMNTTYYSFDLANGIQHNLEGDYNLKNIAAAVAIGQLFNVEQESIRKAIEEYHPQNNRSQRTNTESNSIIVDCYNANPSSMELSIANFLGEIFEGYNKRLLILGDMLELGQWSLQEHTAIIEKAMSDRDADIWLVGEHFAQAYTSSNFTFPNVRLFRSSAEVIEAIKSDKVINHAILLKGSRGIGLEKVLAVL